MGIARVDSRLFASLLFVCLTTAASGQTFTWQTVGSGAFDLPGNWSPAGGPPNSSAETALFNQAITYNVGFLSDFTNAGARVEDGTVTFVLNQHAYSLSTAG